MRPKNKNKKKSHQIHKKNPTKFGLFSKLGLTAKSNLFPKLGLFLISPLLVLTILITASTHASTVATWQATASTGCPTLATTYNSDLVSNGSSLYEVYTSSFYKFNTTTYACSALADYSYGGNDNPIALSNGQSNQIFGLTGNYLSYYNITNDFWINPNYAFGKSTISGNLPVAWTSTGTGLGLTSATDGTDIYVLFGNNTTFKKYSPGSNTWTTLTGLPASNYSGSAMVYYSGDIYTLRGNNSTNFYKYNIVGNSWSSLTAVPTAVNGGGSLTLVGTKIFATVGGDKKNFYIYNPATDLWTDSDPGTTIEDAPDFIWGGGATVTFGGNIYALQGNETKNFWKYTVDTDGGTGGLQGAWNSGSTPAQIPEIVYAGGTLATDGTYIYATTGLYSKNIYRYDPTLNSWTQLTDMPIGIGSSDNYYYNYALTDATGNLLYLNNNIWETSLYADTNLALFRYSLTGSDANTWPYYKNLPNIPATSGAGASLTYPGVSADDPPGDFLYALIGNNTKKFFRYSISNFAWIPWIRGKLADDSLISQDTSNNITEGAVSIVQAGGKFYFWGSGTYFFEYNPTTNKWKRLTDAPYGTSGGGSGSALVAKGSSIYLSVSGQIGKYDIDSDQWYTGYTRGMDENGVGYKQNTFYPNYEYQGASITEVNGKIYLLPSGSTPYFQEFDPISNSWIWLSSAPGSIYGGSTTVTAGTDIYVLRGNSTNDFYKFDTLTDTWSTLTSFIGDSAGIGRSMGYASGDYIYALNGNNTKSFYRYSISGNSWTAMTDAPDNAYRGSAITNYSTTDLYVLAGESTNKFWKYNIAGNTWDDTIAQAPDTVYSGAGLVTTPGNIIYAIRGGATKNFWKYDPALDQWTISEYAPINVGTTSSYDYGRTLTYSSTLGDIFMTPGNASSTTESYIHRYKLSVGTGQNSWRYLKGVASAPGWTSGWGEALSYPGTGDLIYLLGAYSNSYFFSFNTIANEWNIFTKSILDDGQPISQSGVTQSSPEITEVNGVFYIAPGGNTAFEKFDPSTNTWTTFATLPSAGTFRITKYTNDIFYLLKDDGTLFKYVLSTNTWTTLAAIGATTSNGFSMTYPGSGSYLYAFRGNNTNKFYRYDITQTPGLDSWDDTPTDLSEVVGNGGSLVSVGGDIYAFGGTDGIGGGGNTLWKYSITGDSWSVQSTTPAQVSTGAALTTDGTDIYAVLNNTASTFYKYVIGTDTWTAKTASSLAFNSGNSMVYSSTLNEIYYAPPGSGGNIVGGHALLYRYKVGTNSWPTLTIAPSPNDGVTTYAATGCNSMTKTAHMNRYIYATAVPNGANCDNPVFLRFDTQSNTWTRLADPLGGATMSGGASMTLDTDNNKIYATAGNATKGYYVYDIASDTWTAATSTPINVGTAQYNSNDGELEYYNNTVWLAPGGCASNNITETNCGLLYRYDTATTSWPTINSVSALTSEQNFNGGSDLTSSTDGEKIYALQGSSLIGTDSNFWGYDIATNTWSAKRAILGTDIRSGGNLTTRDANTIFAMRGKGTTDFYNYNITTNTWSSDSNQLFPVSVGSTSNSYNLGGLAYNSIANAMFGFPGSNAIFYKLDLTPRAVITSINGGSNPVKTTPFSVVVESEDELGNPVNVTQATTVTLSVNTGTGVLGGTTSGIISIGTSQATILGVTYSKAETGIILTATDTTSGSTTLLSTNSSSFTVNALAPTIGSIDPVLGPATGGTAITLTGTNFQRGFKRPITITSGTLLSNYPVSVTIDTAALIAASKINADCSDIRFKDSDGTTDINFWFDPSTCNTSTTEAWVKVPTVANGSTIIYLAYGNADAVTQSNGANVFDFFDDFNGNHDFNNTTLDTSKWDKTEPGGTNISQNNRLIIANGYSSWTGMGVFSKATFSREKEFRFKYMATCENGSSYKDTTMVGWKNSNDSIAHTNMVHSIYFYDPSSGSPEFHTYENSSDSGSLGSFTCGQQYWLKIQTKPFDFFSTGGANYYYSTDNQNWNLLTSTSTVTDSPLKVGFTHYEGGIDYIDNTFIKSYTATEPTTLIGTESTSIGLTFGSITATDITYVGSTSITATTPAHTTGSVDVILTNPDLQTVTLSGGFTYENSVSASESTVSASPTTVVADNATTSTVTVTLKTSTGVPVAGKTVSLTKTLGLGIPTITAVTCGGLSVPGISDTLGRACFTVRSSTIANNTFTATDTTDSVTITQTASVNFIGTTADAGTSTVSASVASVVANDLSTSTITVTLEDSANNPLSGKTVSLAKTSGSGTPTITAADCGLGGTFGTSDSNGQACFTVRSQTAAEDIFTATDTTDTVTVTQTATVTFTPGTPNAGTSTVTASLASIPADGLTTSTVTVTLKDIYSNLVSGKNVSLTKTSGPGTPTITAVICGLEGTAGVSNTSGQACFTVKSTTAGTDVFTAQDTSDTILITQTASVNFIGTTADAGTSTVSASAASVVANDLSTSTITVTLKDSANNPLSGKTVSLAKTSGSGTPTITAANCGLGGTFGTSDSNGEACFTVKSQTAAENVFTATDTTDTITVTQTATVTFTPGTPNNGTSTVTASLASIPADDLTTSTITVTLKDIYSNLVSGKNVSLTKSAGPGTPTITAVTCGLGGTAGVSNTSGQACFTVKSSTAGTDVFTAQDTTDSVTITQTASVNFIGTTADAGTSTVSASVASVVANDLSTSTITVTLEDSANNPLSGKTVSLAKTSGSGTPTITAADCGLGGTFGTSDSNGEACFTVKSQTAAEDIFTATDTTDTVTVTQTATVTFTPGTPNNGTSTVTASLASIPADDLTTSTITVTLKDIYSNLVSGKNVSLTKTSGPGTPTITAVTCGLGGTAGVSNTSGQACFTVKSSTAGTDVFTAADTTDSVTITQTASVTFTAASANAGTSTVSASASSIQANNLTTSTITVTLKDSDSNPVSSKNVSLSKTGPGTPTITAVDCGLGGTFGTSDSNGQACFTVKSSTRGIDIFTATDTTDSVTITQTASVEFTCVTTDNEQCVTVQINSGALSIFKVPDTLNFNGINISRVAQNLFSANATGYSQNDQALVTVEDLRNSSGFILQLTASALADLSDPTNFIPLQNFYVLNSPSSTGGTSVGGIEYNSGSSGPQTITAPLNFVGSLITASNFTLNGSTLGTGTTGTPVDLMSGGLSTSTGRLGKFSSNVNYYVQVPALQPVASYRVTLTFDVMDAGP